MVQELIFSSEMKEITDQVKMDIEKKHKNNYKKWLVAGSVSMLTLAGILYFSQQNEILPSTSVKVSNDVSSIDIEQKNLPAVEQSTVQKSYKTEKDNRPKEIKNTSSKPAPAGVNSEFIVKENHTDTIIQDQIISEMSNATNNLVETEDSSIKEVVSKKLIDPCLGFSADVKIETKKAAYEKSNGEIIVLSDKDYLIRLKETDTSFEQTNKFQDLSAGIYYLQIKDNNDCLLDYSMPIEVKTNYCHEQIDYLFNLAYDSELEIKIGSPSRSIAIKDRSSNQVIWQEVTYEEESYTWDGTHTNGGDLTEGLFFYEIETESGTKCEGSITIRNK